jgi:DNA mismatch repair protein MutH
MNDIESLIAIETDNSERISLIEDRISRLEHQLLNTKDKVKQPVIITSSNESDNLAFELRSKLPIEVLNRTRIPTLKEVTSILDECVKNKVLNLSMGRAIGALPKSLKDKNWGGRMYETYLGGKNSSEASADFADFELKSTRIVRKRIGEWGIEQVLRITTLSHKDGSNSLEFTQTPFYNKIKHFICILTDSKKNQAGSGSIVDYFIFNINDHPDFLKHIKEDYEYLSQFLTDNSTTHISSTETTPNGFLYVRETGSKKKTSDKKTSSTSIYISKTKFDELLKFYGKHKIQ